MKYRKKPVVVEAMQFMGDGKSAHAIQEWGAGHLIVWHMHAESLSIPTLEGTMYANKGDWIIRGVNGEYYPCKPDMFDKTYEPVEDGKENT